MLTLSCWTLFCPQGPSFSKIQNILIFIEWGTFCHSIRESVPSVQICWNLCVPPSRLLRGGCHLNPGGNHRRTARASLNVLCLPVYIFGNIWKKQNIWYRTHQNRPALKIKNCQHWKLLKISAWFVKKWLTYAAFRSCAYHSKTPYDSAYISNAYLSILLASHNRI